MMNEYDGPTVYEVACAGDGFVNHAYRVTVPSQYPRNQLQPYPSRCVYCGTKIHSARLAPVETVDNVDKNRPLVVQEFPTD